MEEEKYICPICRRWFIRGMQCLVNHLPGTCCHEYEKQTTPPKSNNPSWWPNK